MAKKKVIKKVKVPKVVAIDAPRPKIADLRAVYAGLITANDTQMDAALRYALQWFDRAVAYVRQDGLDDAQADGLAAALAFRRKGIQTAKVSEKINYYKDAIGCYQLLAQSGGLQVPLLDEYISVVDASHSKLKEVEDRLGSKYATVLATLTKAMRYALPDGRLVEYKIAPIKVPYFLDPELGVITISRIQAKRWQLILRTKGLVALLEAVWEPVTRISGLEPERDDRQRSTGKLVHSPALQLKAVSRLFQQFVAYGLSDDAPNKLLKKPVSKVAIEKRKGGGFGKREYDTILKIAVKPSAMYTVIMKLGDEQWHEKSELAALIAPTSLDGRLIPLKRISGEMKTFVIEETGSQIRMLLNQEEEGNGSNG